MKKGNYIPVGWDLPRIGRSQGDEQLRVALGSGVAVAGFSPESQVRQASSLGLLVVVTATLLTLLANPQRAVLILHQQTFTFNYQLQNTLFFPCESSNTCGILSKTHA